MGDALRGNDSEFTMKNKQLILNVNDLHLYTENLSGCMTG